MTIRAVLIFTLIIQSLATFGQLTIEACHKKAMANYPLAQQHGLITQSEEYSVENAAKGYLPQVVVSARATYQSDVTEFPVKMPGVSPMSKDQYQAAIEVNQILWDGGIIRSQKETAKTSAEVERRKLEVDLYSLKERVNQLFFGYLLLNEQIALNDILIKELENSYSRVSAYIQNGVAFQSDLDVIRVEQIKARQRLAELESTRKSYREMLSAFIGEQIDENVELVKPSFQSYSAENLMILRPELNLFDVQSNLLESQKQTIASSTKPKIGLFLQGGYGKPGLNMLEDEFTHFYIGGIRLTWNIGAYYTQCNSLSKIEIARKTVDLSRETFLFNTNMQISRQMNDIERLRELIGSDEEIIKLRQSIKLSAEKRVENGTLTVSDLVREVNAENLAVQEKALHEIQLLMAIYNLKVTTNN